MVFPFGFFAGSLGILAAPALPPMAFAWLAALVAVAAFALFRRFATGVVVCGACCGMLWTAYHAREYLNHRWPSRLADERVIASVVVDSIPVPIGTDWAFDGIAFVEAPASLRQPLRVRVVQRDAAIRPRAGERWRMLLALRPPRGRANPGGRDFERHQFRERVHALGTVIPSGINRRIDDGYRPLASLRERISLHIQSQVADRDGAALIAALAVGDTGSVSREQWRVFNATGTTHLVAISGLHVTLFAMVAFFAARRLWSLCVRLSCARRGLGLLGSGVRSATRWVSACPRETFAAVVGFSAAAGYATLAGLSVPTQRTLIMLGVWLLARSVARATRPFQPFALSLIVVLLADPFAPLSAGFWLSFAAMGAIILITSDRFVRRPMWREALAVQTVVTIVLLPISLALFGSVSLVGPLVNVIAIPVMSWILVPTILLCVVLMPVSTVAANAMLVLAARLHDIGWPLLAAASDVPWALLHASPPPWWYALAALAIAMALLPWPLLLRVAALVCLVPLATAVDGLLEPGSVEITVLDAGEGTSVVVRTAQHVLVFGTGDSYGTDGRIAETVLVPFLRSRGVRAIDRLMLSNDSAATASGVTALLAEMPVRETLVESFRCAQAPPGWSWDGITFTRHTDAGHACVLSVSTSRGRALIPGDIDASAEVRLASAHDLRADIVVVPRNGSDAASSWAFIDAVRPRWAVVSGRRVQRSSPKRALARWEQRGAQVLATADLGAIRFRIDATRGIEGPAGQRADQRVHRLWAASP
jgi:competence protein ComEC